MNVVTRDEWLIDFADCESMDKCNLTDAVPGNDGPKFSEMGQQEKLKVCR